MLLQLAGGVAGQLRDDLEPGGLLERCDPIGDERLDLLEGGRVLRIGGSDDRQRGLDPLRVRDADHARVRDLRVRGDGLFDLDGRDVLATGDDDVLRTVDHVVEALVIHPHEVTGVEPAAS